MCFENIYHCIVCLHRNHIYFPLLFVFIPPLPISLPSFTSFFSELKQIEGHEDVLVDMLLQCTDFLDRGIFVTPDDKYCLLRGLPHLLLLIDGTEDDGSYNVFKQKKLKLDPIKALFRTYPILPMYGDMPIRPEVILQRAPHYDISSMGTAWGGGDTDKKVVADYQITTHWKTMRKQYDHLLSRLVLTVKDVQQRQKDGLLEKDMGSVQLGKKVSAMVNECFSTLREWCCHVQETVAWKMSNPCPEEMLVKYGITDEARKSPGFNYERCVRYNFNKQERSILVDITTMIKSLANYLRQAESTLSPLVRMHIHRTIQRLGESCYESCYDFFLILPLMFFKKSNNNLIVYLHIYSLFLYEIVQTDLVPALHRADKSKRSIVTTLLQLRVLGADWMGGVELKDDFKKYSAKAGASKGYFK